MAWSAAAKRSDDAAFDGTLDSDRPMELIDAKSSRFHRHVCVLADICVMPGFSSEAVSPSRSVGALPPHSTPRA